MARYRVSVFAPSNTETQLKALRDALAEQGEEPIEIDGHSEDAPGMRKMAAGWLDAVYSYRDRGWGIVAAEDLEGKVRYAGADKEILYYAGMTRAYPQPEVINRLFQTWRDLYRSGEAGTIIERYGPEPAAVGE